ncbi:unnamed protein product [Strongylus vulgaris]|uniref:Uncharacterized protein n=1 Tax=Strongylus vulgaris TaxID=40348 RepID=A0A3P7IJU0_STRVU|nr:unnamed protein product [Strongylus vulgaris]
MQSQQGLMQSHRMPIGQYEQAAGFGQRQQQMTQGYPQEVPESPGVMQMQQQHMIPPNVGQVDGTSAVYARQQQMVDQQQQQQIISQQQQQQQLMNQQVGFHPFLVDFFPFLDKAGAFFEKMVHFIVLCHLF